MDDQYEISFFRGDFYPKVLTITNALTKEPVDLTGIDLILTVNKEKDPIDTANEIFKVNGVVTDPLLGRVSFCPTALNNDLPKGKYYYDVSAIAGVTSKRTLIKSTWNITMDIGKD